MAQNSSQFIRTEMTPESNVRDTDVLICTNNAAPAIFIPVTKDSVPSLTQTMKRDQPIEESDDERVVPLAPDGGYGWVVMVASFFCNFIVDGVSYSFAVYFIEWMDYFPKDSKAVIALIGALLNGFYLCMGPISSALANAFGFRIVIFSGAIISAFAFICSMFAPSVSWLVITFGIMGGTGFGLIYSPAILCVCYYFNTKRALAVGISVCGSGVGALVLPPLIELIVETYGWHGSMLLLAGLVLQVCVAGAFMRTLEIEITEQMERRPAHEEMEAFLTDTPTYVREGSELGVTVSLPTNGATGGDSRYLKRIHSEPSRDAGLVDVVTSRKYFSRYGIDIMTVEKGAVRHLYKAGEHRRDFSTKDISQDELHSQKTVRRSSIAARPLDRKDIFHRGSLKHLDQKTKSKVEMDIFRNSESGLKNNRRHVLAEKIHKRSCLPLQLSQAFAEMIDLRIYRNVVFIIICVSNFLGMIAFYIPAGYISKFVEEKFEVPLTTAVYLISAIGGANIFGRVFFGWLADRPKMDPLLISNTCVFIVGVVVFCIPACQRYYDVMAVCLVFGFFVAPFVSLLSIILTSQIGLDLLPSAFGHSQFVCGIASMLGTPIAGGLLDATGNNFTPVFCAAGGALLAASLIASLIFVLPFFTKEKVFRNKDVCAR